MSTDLSVFDGYEPSCLVPDCPLTGSTQHGFCRDHQNRLNARGGGYLKCMTEANRVALAAHPGWRSRPFVVFVYWSAPKTCRFAVARAGAWVVVQAFDRAVDALAELDRRNGVAPVGEVAALRAQLETARSERDLAVKLAEAIRSELAAVREALDKQATTVARLTSELAERERDVTYACGDRDEYRKERDEARFERDTLAIKVKGFRTLLTLARRPWWVKLWAWVSGGGGK